MMTVLYAMTIAAYLACGLYMMLSRHVVRMVLGISLLTNGAIFLLFFAGRVGTGIPAVIPSGAEVLPVDAANSLPQALALTAIVIGFALTAFAVALVVAAWRRLHTLDTQKMIAAEAMGNPFATSTKEAAKSVVPKIAAAKGTSDAKVTGHG
jgi:multicomponent Na+:H+ antiporter subunit C